MLNFAAEQYMLMTACSHNYNPILYNCTTQKRLDVDKDFICQKVNHCQDCTKYSLLMQSLLPKATLVHVTCTVKGIVISGMVEQDSVSDVAKNINSQVCK